MKTIRLIATIALILLANTAQAQGESPWYAGFKGGLMDAGNSLSDDALNAGFNLGYRHNRFLSTEAEYTRTLIDGDLQNGNDWTANTLSVYAAFRTDTAFKFKAKIGLSDMDGDLGSELSISTGVGVAFWAAGGLTEIEYTQLNSNYSFFSLGIQFFF